MLKFTILAICLCAAAAYPSYKPLLPNGAKVPNPCGGGIWTGVGHLDSHGTGPLNQFGIDFAAAGHVWSNALCMKDSDGDGSTNGVELGDPMCVWTPDSHLHLQKPLGHPGIDERTYQCI